MNHRTNHLVTRFPLLVFSFVMLSGVATAQSDVEAGHALAQEWCSRCHNIEPDAPAKLEPPSFAAIAGYRHADFIAANIMVPHSRMPKIAQVLNIDVNKLVAYIVSLEKPCP